jgi:transposase-like protein
MSGRPVRYTQEDKEAIMAEYDQTPRGDRRAIAERLGITPRSLIIYICKWRKERKGLEAQAVLEADLPF